MNWSETRKRLLALAKGRESEEEGASEGRSDERSRRKGSLNGRSSASSSKPSRSKADASAKQLTAPFASSLCIASGKGGTGKSVVTAALSGLFSARGRTLLIDADLGVGNAHILQDLTPKASFVEVVRGEKSVREVVEPCSGQCDLLAAGSGVPRMAELNDYELYLIADGLSEIEAEYRYTLVDSAAGVSRQTFAFAEACDLTLIVTTPDITSMTDAYAFLKVLSAKKPEPRPLILINRARDEAEAEEVMERILRVCQRFLTVAPRFIGWIPDDEAVRSAVNRRGPVTLLEPNAEASRSFRQLAVALLEELGKLHPGGLGRSMRSSLGYSRSKSASF